MPTSANQFAVGQRRLKATVTVSKPRPQAIDTAKVMTHIAQAGASRCRRSLKKSWRASRMA